MKPCIALSLTVALLARCAETVSTNLATGQGLVADLASVLLFAIPQASLETY